MNSSDYVEILDTNMKRVRAKYGSLVSSTTYIDSDTFTMYTIYRRGSYWEYITISDIELWESLDSNLLLRRADGIMLYKKFLEVTNLKQAKYLQKVSETPLVRIIFE